MGLGACAIGGFDEGMIVKLLDLPEDSKPCLFITAGYPESGVPVPRRRAVKEIIRREV
jgi:nitroreductase